MSEKQFTRENTDILPDDLALLVSTQPGAGATSEGGAPHEVDVPSIPSGPAGNEPARPTAPMTLPPAAPPPTGQEVNPLQTEPASLEPPDSIAAEPMAPAPREQRSLGPEAIPVPAMAEAQVTAPVMAEVTVLPDEPPTETAIIAPATAAASPARSHEHSDAFDDRVTLLEISPLVGGGTTEAPLPGNRAGSPPAPLPARRIGWNHPVARWGAYALVVVALSFVFLWLLVDLFHVG